MSAANEPATVEKCQQDYASRASANPQTAAAAQNPGRITGNDGIHRQQGGAAGR